MRGDETGGVMSMSVDPEELQALADRLVGQAERIGELDPAAPVGAAVASALAAATEHAADAIAAAYRESADRRRAAADNARSNAANYLAADRTFATGLSRVGLGQP